MTALRLSLSACLVAIVAAASSTEARPRPYSALNRKPPAPSVSTDLERANAAARVQPATTAFANAEQVYAFMPGALFQVYTTVGKVTDIALQAGENLVGTGPVAAGDTARWIIGSTESGNGETRQIHILVKPTLPSLATNLVVNTDRRTYHIELQALPNAYMASVSWRYPQDELVAISQASERAKAVAPVASDIDPSKLNFRYRLDGDTVPWRPLRSFDDGQRVYIEMPAATAGTDLPPLFLIGTGGKAELVNYRIQANFIIVDRLFDRAELRLGDKGRQKAVRIVRLAGGRP